MPQRSRTTLVIAAVGLLIAGAVWVGATQPWRDETTTNSTAATATSIGPGDEAVLASERARRGSNAAVREVSLTAAPASIDLGDRTVETWAFNGTVPGPEIRVEKGDVLRALVQNDLPEPMTIHWHGIALRNDMDGVPDLTQESIEPGASFTYEFTVPDAGTFFYHPHTGTQLDRGLYAPLIIEDPDEGSDYDTEAVIVLDDWLDGVDGRDPDKELARLREQGMAGMDMGGQSGGMDHGGMSMSGSAPMSAPSDPAMPLGTDTGDVQYPYYLINGRLGTDPVVLQGRPGQRMRLRIINASAMTIFRNWP